jgi:uncharacterized protein Yka (UPF0111/DUF47 family)
MRCRRTLLKLAVLALFLPCLTHTCARAQDSYLSDAEVEKLRDTAPIAPERVQAFIDFINQRADRIDKLASGKRVPGREEDIHDLMKQIASILDDLDDNLDDYSKRHQDLRKILPKLIAATERWGTALKSPAEDQEYSVQRKLALESLSDVHESATRMVDEQKAWFAAHPPSKEGTKKGEG